MRSQLTSRVALTAAILLAVSSLAAAQPSAVGALSQARIEALLKLKTPDSTVSGEITRRGLAFTPDGKTLDRLRALGAGPLTLAAVEALRPVFEDARQQVPDLLTTLYKALDEGDLQRARPLVSAELGADARKLDSICRPFTYRAHYVEGLVERPGRAVEARVRVLSKPVSETAYVLVLRASGGQWQVQNVMPAPDEWFGPLVTSAQDLGHKFAYALKAGRRDILEQVVSGINLELLFRGRCGEAVKSMGDVSRESGLGTQDAKGLKGVAGVWLQRGGEWRFFVEPVGNEPRIVRFQTDLRGCDRNEYDDPALESRTLVRFGLASEAVAAAPPAAGASSSAIDARTATSLQEEAHAALRTGDHETAYRRWDEILEAGGTITLPACREGSGFGRCTTGRLSVSGSEVRFVDEVGKTLLSIKPSEAKRLEFETSKLALSKESVGRLKMRVGEKNQNFNYIPESRSECDGGKFYGCLDGSPSLAQQAAVARYLARTIARLAATPPTPGTESRQQDATSPPDTPSGAIGLAGLWIGDVSQPGFGSYEARLLLPKDWSGSNGLSKYPSLGCDGSLKLLESGAGRVILKETIDRGKDTCASGVTIEGERQADGALKLRFLLPDGKVAASGTLSKR